MVGLKKDHNRRSRFAGIVAGIAMMMLIPGHTVAQTGTTAELSADLRLGVIDVQSVIQRSTAMAVIHSALDEQNSAFQTSISEEELELRQAERELNDAQTSLPKDEFETQVKEFEERVNAMQRSIQNQKNRFDLSIQQAQSQLEQELLRIVSEIAQERQLSMVIQRQNVVIYNNNLDITEEVLIRLNERTKNLTLTRQDDADN